MRTLTASDRSALIRLASAMPKGGETRRAILAGLSRLAEESEGDTKSKGKGPGKDFVEYMKEVWDGGKKKVSNPNSKTRDAHPEVAVSTAMKDKKSPTYKQVMDGFKKWTEEKKKDEGKKKDSGTKEQDIDWDGILKANPIFKDKKLKNKMKAWEALQEEGLKQGFKDYSDELANFVGEGMKKLNLA